MAEFATHTADVLGRLGAENVPLDADLTIEQRVTQGDDVVDRFQVIISDGSVTVDPEGARDPDVTISQDVETARALRAGEIHAQRAFLTGRLSIDGDIDALLANGALLTSLLKVSDA